MSQEYRRLNGSTPMQVYTCLLYTSDAADD